MHFPSLLTPLLLLTLPTTSSPVTPRHGTAPHTTHFDTSITSIPPLSKEVLEKAYPNSKTCDNPPYPKEECDTAATAAPNIELSYIRYSLTTLGQKAAVLATLALESGNFKANINHSNNRPGQGTKAMLMFPNIVAFANSIDVLRGRVRELGGRDIPANGEVRFADVDRISPDVQRGVRGLVLPRNTTYAAAAWYLAAGPGCPRDTMRRLSADRWAGFEYYVTKCLQAGEKVDEGRKKKWCSAVAVLAPAGMDVPSECQKVALEK